MVVAVLTSHAAFGFFMNWSGQQKGEGFEYHLLALALALPIIVKGAGAFSVDRAAASALDQAQPDVQRAARGANAG